MSVVFPTSEKALPLTSLRQRLGNDELREIDLVLQEIGDGLLGVFLGSLDVALDEHLAQAGLDDGDDEAAVISTDSLKASEGESQPRRRQRRRQRELTSIPLVSILSHFSGFVQ